jgi:hypothetical protein
MGLTSSGVTRVGQRIGLGAGCAHGICADSRGDLSVAEVPHPFVALRGLVPTGSQMFQKFTKA